MIELLVNSENRQRLLISAKRNGIKVWQNRRQVPHRLGWLDRWSEWEAIETAAGPVPEWAESVLAPIRQRAEKMYPRPTEADYLVDALRFDTRPRRPTKPAIRLERPAPGVQEIILTGVALVAWRSGHRKLILEYAQRMLDQGGDDLIEIRAPGINPPLYRLRRP